MDLLMRLLTGGSLQAATPGPTDDFWYRSVGPLTWSGVRVDEEGAQKISGWFRGRDILATSLAMLPFPVYRRLPNEDGREIAPAHPLYDVLHRKPNPWQNSFDWRRQKMYHLIDHGNGYDRIVPGPRGFADQLWPIHPSAVRPEQLDSGRLVYHVRLKGGSTVTATQDEILHLRGASTDGVVGKGILEYASECLGLGITLEQYASKIFSRGSLNAGFIKIPGSADEASMKRLAETYMTSRGDWHLPKILDRGAEFQSASLEPEKAQFILSRKFTVNDIARWLGLPPHMIGDLERSTNNNIEHQGQEFVTYSLGPWLSMWEFAINDQLILRPETYYAEFTRDALVRGDIATRWEAYVKSTNAGIRTRNEVRRLENLRALPGLDTPLDPANIIGNRRASDGFPPAQRDDSDRGRAIAEASAARILRKEISAVQRLAVKYAADADGFAVAVTDFYADHAAFVAEVLQIDAAAAADYCSQQAAQVVAGTWAAALDVWGTTHYAAGVAALALEAS